MPEVHKSKDGSLEVWPRKRASRSHPSLDSWADSDQCKPLAFAGWKAGMTQVVQKDLRKNSPTKNQLLSVPVTVLDTPPLFLFGARSYETTPEGLKASENIGAPEEKIPTVLREGIPVPDRTEFEEEPEEIRLLVCTQPERSGMGKSNPEAFEIPLGGDLEEKKEFLEETMGGEIEAGEVFGEGQFLDATAVTKGKGFEGPVKRYGVKIDRRKDKTPRHVGSMGARGQGRVLFSTPQPGQEGYHRRTDESKHLLMTGEAEKINPEGGFKNYGFVKESFLALKGSVPGPRKRLVMLRRSLKEGGEVPVEIKEIKTGSQQGV